MDIFLGGQDAVKFMCIRFRICRTADVRRKEAVRGRGGAMCEEESSGLLSAVSAPSPLEYDLPSSLILPPNTRVLSIRGNPNY